MGHIVYCDGCDHQWKVPNEILTPPFEPAIRIERINGMGGGGLPAGAAHWCTRCAQVAVAAVAEAHRKRSVNR